MTSRLDAALRDKPLPKVEIRRDTRGRRPPEPGVCVRHVEARGKHCLVHFSDGSVLHTHMQMTGAWHTYRAGERWRAPGREARVVLEAADGTQAVCFSAPLVDYRVAGDRRPSRAQRMLDALGPDLCDEAVDFGEILRRLGALDPTTPIGEVLLDQSVAAGIGNVYRSEVCFACGMNPFRPLGDVPETARRGLYETAHEQLRANIDRPRRETFEGGLAVYDRSGWPCPRCGAALRSARFGSPARSVWWCEGCQPLANPGE